MSESVFLQAEYVPVTCGVDGCGVPFALSRAMYREKQRTGESFYCPRGHRISWSGNTIEDKLRAAEARERHLADQLHAAEADAERSRVALVRARHRFANGVCPCCNRTFDNVRRHMETKHPELCPSWLAQSGTLAAVEVTRLGVLPPSPASEGSARNG